MIEIFRTEDYIIRTFSMKNFDDFTKLNMDDCVSKYVNHDPNEKGKTFRECIEKFKEISDTQEKYGFSYWAIYLLNDTFIGQCGLSEDVSENFNFCYMYKKEYWGKGIGFKVAKLILNYVYTNFADKVSNNKIKAMSFVNNVASIKLLNKLGFKYIKSSQEFNKELQFFELSKERFYEQKQ